MRPALLTALLLLAAGCVGDEPGGGAVPQPEPPVEAAPAPLGLEDCEQTHAFVPLPRAAFQDGLPEGWDVVPADAAGLTTQFLYAVSRCLGSDRDLLVPPPYAEAWGYVFVTPPGEPDENVTGELWPLGAVVATEELKAVYDAWGLVDLVAVGDVAVERVADTGGSVVVRSLARGGGEVFDLRAGVPADPDEFHNGTFRVWVPDAEAASGVAGGFHYKWEEGRQVGLGAGTLLYSGPLLNAPPQMDALVHHVEGVSVWVGPFVPAEDALAS